MAILRSYYSDDLASFLTENPQRIIERICSQSDFAAESSQKNAWIEQTTILQSQLSKTTGSGKIFYEFTIPRLGKRIDILLILNSVIYVLEFKTGDSQFTAQAIDQAWDYALDLKNFHNTSHDKIICPVLITTKSKEIDVSKSWKIELDGVTYPIAIPPSQFQKLIDFSQASNTHIPAINIEEWENGQYEPTPTIVEAASALFKNHDVKEISRSDASAVNLSETTTTLENIIEDAKLNNKKAICFVTGVPGAGKTLVGLNVATKNRDENSNFHSVFLSGNAPLVTVLREALIRDSVEISRKSGQKLTKKNASQSVIKFIQNIHHFRDDCITDLRPPIDHVVIFDEAQRAWNREQTSSFMQRKKGLKGFNKSEPEFLISCMNRHKDWAVIICLVGGGQEINTGEAGISAWLEAIDEEYPNWEINISSQLSGSEYNAKEKLTEMRKCRNVNQSNCLHLSVSMRSFRAEKVSHFVKSMLDINIDEAIAHATEIKEKYPIKLTRNVNTAKKWIRETARGNERYGMVVSSQASRLKPLAIDIRVDVDPKHWFLGNKEDVRSSYYLEDVATEFVVQGLELDWACIVWDADFRYTEHGWKHSSFVGDKWQNILKHERQSFLKNAYRVLLTRARQGMIIVIPEGDKDDPTRPPHFYDETFQYLKNIGLDVIH